jgi:hypothetical protein
LHRVEPAAPPIRRKRRKRAARIAARAEVLYEPAVSDREYECRYPMLDPREQAAHRRAVADTQITDAPSIDVAARVQKIDRPPQIDDQLDLFGAIAFIEPDRIPGAARERRIDRNGNRPSRANSNAIDNMSRRELGMPCWTMSPAKGPSPSGTTTNAGTRPPPGLA